MRPLLRSLTLLLALALPSAALAQPALEVKVFTASPGGFLVNSTLVAGAKDAILIDGQFALADAHRLVAWLIESGKNLTTVYVTHDHPDHYFGLEVIKQAFPKVKIVALPGTVARIKKTAKPKVDQWKPLYGANLTSRPIIPTALRGTTLTVEGQTLEIVGPVQGDDDGNTYVWIPSIKTVVAGDVVFSGVFPWTAETAPAGRKAWIATLDQIAARAPAVVVPGHQKAELKQPPASVTFTRDYLVAFDEALASSKSADELQGKVKAKYGDLALDVILEIAAKAAFPPAPAK